MAAVTASTTGQTRTTAPIEEVDCPICCSEPETVSNLGKRMITLPCDSRHSMHLYCIIRMYATPPQADVNPRIGQMHCPLCRKDLDIVDAVIFAHLKPQHGVSTERRRADMNRIFHLNVSEPAFMNASQDEQKRALSRLFWGNDTLFDNIEQASPQKRQVLNLIRNPWSLTDTNEREARLRQLFNCGTYVEALDGEPPEIFHARHNLFARRVAPYQNDTHNIAQAMSQEAYNICSQLARMERKLSRPAALGAPEIRGGQQQMPTITPTTNVTVTQQSEASASCCSTLYSCIYESGLWIFLLIYSIAIGILIYLNAQ